MAGAAKGLDAEGVVFEFLDFLDSRYGITKTELNRLISSRQKEPSIPAEILANRDLGPMESLVKFLRENRQLSYQAISGLVGRSRSTVGVMYHNASRKLPAPFSDYPSSAHLIPLSQFRHPKYTALEAAVMFLKGGKLRVCQIAELLNRDYRTIYTIYRRGRRKDEE